MARYSRLEVLNAMHEIGIVVVFYHPDLEVVKNVATACAEGGARLLEFTNRGDFAHETFADLEKFCAKQMPQMITGVGSIVDPGTASLYIANGANFVVGPVLNAEVAKTCNRRKIPYSPGCGSASEISAAEELGCEVIKVFPGAEVGGPAFVKNVRGPCPWTSIMPTGGVEPTEESLKKWFDAGITCAGIGSQLITKELLDKKDYQSMTVRVREAIETVRRVRPKKKA
jgi:2-dehydro-3-deoxyphosphogluconate aldolase / (4S)-4-hydroxy-2-oxoglutarate aldolase